MNRKTLIPLFLFLTLLISINTNYVYAYNKIDLNTPSHTPFHPQKTATKIGEKYVYIIPKTGGLHIYVCTEDSLYGHTEITFTEYPTTLLKDISITTYNDEEIIILTSGYPTTSKISFFGIKYNVNTLSYQYDCSDLQSGTTSEEYLYISPIFITEEQYAKVIVLAKLGATKYLFTVTYRISENTLTYVYGESSYYIGYIYGFNSTSDTAYYITSLQQSPEKTITVSYTGGAAFTQIAQEPFESFSNTKYMRYIGGGIYHNETADTYILYHSWVTTENQFVDFVLWRLKFNNSIESENLDTQTIDKISLTMNYKVEPSYWNVVSGYVENYTTYHIYSPTYDSEIEQYKIVHHKITYTDWYNLNDDNVITWDYPSELMFVSPQNPETYAWRFIESTFEHEDNGEDAYVYGDLLTLVRSYTLSLDYSPKDDPPKSYTNYLFTVTSKRNNEPYDGGIVTVYVDDVLYKVLEIQNGEATFTYYTTIAGYHNFTLTLNDLGEQVKTYTKTYLFISGQPDIETEPYAVSEMMVNLMTTVLPFLIVVLLPAIILAHYTENLYGFVAGLTLGIIMGYTTGLLPNYALFLFGLVLILIVYKGVKG